MLFVLLALVSIIGKEHPFYKFMLALIILFLAIIGSLKWSQEVVYPIKNYEISSIDCNLRFADIIVNKQPVKAKLKISNNTFVVHHIYISKLGLLTIPLRADYYEIYLSLKNINIKLLKRKNNEEQSAEFSSRR